MHCTTYVGQVWYSAIYTEPAHQLCFILIAVALISISTRTPLTFPFVYPFSFFSALLLLLLLLLCPYFVSLHGIVNWRFRDRNRSTHACTALGWTGIILATANSPLIIPIDREYDISSLEKEKKGDWGKKKTTTSRRRHHCRVRHIQTYSRRNNSWWELPSGYPIFQHLGKAASFPPP